MWGGSLAQYWQSASEHATSFAGQALTAARDVAEAAGKVSETVQAEYRRTFVDLDCQIVKIRSNLLVMEYPAQEKVDRLATRLNADYSQRMAVFNLSGQKYDASKFAGKVMDAELRGLPTLPLELLAELCVSVQNWLAEDSSNVAVVHCYEGYSRSVVLLSCFMAFRGFCRTPSEASHEICEKMELKESATLVPSQRRYLAHFQQFLQGFVPAQTRLRLARVQLNGVPRCFKNKEGKVVFRPIMEIFSSGERVFSSFDAKLVAQAGGSAEDEELPRSFSESDNCVPFQLPLGVEVTADVLLHVRHVHADGSHAAAFDAAFHTGFVGEGLHILRKELDWACDEAKVPEDAFLDVIYEPVYSAEAPAVLVTALELFRQLQKDAKELQAATTETSGPKSSEPEVHEFTALEEKLRQRASDEPAAATAAAAVATGGPLKAAPAGDAELRRALAEAASDAPRQEEGSEAVPSKAKGSDDIDQLFSDFDAALDSVVTSGGAGAGTATAVATPVATAGSAATTAVSGPPDNTPQPPTTSAEDVFGDVDAFLKELDGKK